MRTVACDMRQEKAHSGIVGSCCSKGTSRECSQHGDSINRWKSPDISTEEGTVPPLMGSSAKLIVGTLCRDSAGDGERCMGWGATGWGAATHSAVDGGASGDEAARAQRSQRGGRVEGGIPKRLRRAEA